jgi:hypothetical protein
LDERSFILIALALAVAVVIIASGATLLESRIVLDCEKWNSFEWDARVWKSRIRGPHLAFGELSKNYAGKRPSEERTGPIGAEKSLLMFQGFVF